MIRKGKVGMRMNLTNDGKESEEGRGDEEGNTRGLRWVEV